MSGVYYLQQSDPRPVVNQLMKRYFLRLEEAVAEVEPALRFDDILAAKGVKRPDKDGLVTIDDFLQAVKALLHTGRIEGLGLRFGNRLRLADYGLAGLATATCPTFGDAIQLEGAHATLITATREVSFSISRSGDWVLITLREAHGERWAEHYLIEQELASFLRWIRELLPEVSLESSCRVNIAYPRPPYWRLYRELLQCPVQFQQDANQVILPASWLDLPLEHADPELSRVLDQQCQLIIERLEDQGGLVDRVRRMLMECRGKPPLLQQAAERLGIPVHTFRRRLYEAGTTYKQIVYSVRMELAADYLRDTSLPLQEIAFLLGYESSPNFFIAFKKYWQVPPAEFRRGGG